EAVAAAVVLERVLARGGELAALLELFRRAEAPVRGTRVEQAARVGLVARQVGALIDDLFVPVEAKPGQPVEDRAGGFVRAARLIRVLDAKEELAAVLAGVEPVEERSAGTADVEVTGGARRESYTDGHFDPMRNAEEEGGGRNFDSMRNAETECGGRNSIRCGVRKRKAGGGTSMRCGM